MNLSSIRSGVAMFLILFGLANPLQAAQPLSAPEIDPTSMTGALALLAGGLVMVTDRLGRK